MSRITTTISAFAALMLISVSPFAEPQDKSDSERLQEIILAAEQGDADAQYNLGLMHNEGYGVPQHYTKGVYWDQVDEEIGMTPEDDRDLGLIILTLMYADYTGSLGVTQNDVKAAIWFNMAAEQGHADAQYRLGLKYSIGSGVVEDGVEALKWYHMAAEQGQVDAQYELGNAYSMGLDVSEDLSEARKWYRKAAEQGHASSQTLLGAMYRDLQIYNVAVDWYRRAAEQGYESAQFMLGFMYLEGQGVAQDYQEAYIWASLAAVYGHTTAVEARDKAAEKLSPSELSEAQQEAERRL